MAKTIELNMVRNDLVSLIDAFRLKRSVEVGVQFGEFSYVLLRDSKLEHHLCCDAWQGKFGWAIEDARAYMSEFGDRAEIMQGYSTEVAARMAEAGRQFDFCYIDADHRGPSVDADIKAWLPLMARPCVFAGHDFLVTRLVGVIPVVHKWADELGVPIHLTREKRKSWFLILG